MSSATPAQRLGGSADRWGPLWGSRPADWALSEDQQTPTYEAALDRVDVRPGQRVLDVGCGAGAFLSIIADRGAQAFGIDASEALTEYARRRLPMADLRAGDMEALPYDDDAFDLVTGFNSFFFANDIIAALHEAGRVAKPGAPVVIQVWGRHERNDLEAMKQLIRPFLPPRPADAPAEPDYSAPGVLEELATRAGLTPETTFDVTWAIEYPDREMLGRAMVAVAGINVLVGEREEEVKNVIADGLAEYRTPAGGYRLDNEYHFLIARTELRR
ncbi:MAG TPA: class I SAM-dependent methyltransferase [Solirubrobacteraceae bacterium]|nr:class I SAM-dependent methyltransferase [Solirubrobacteraceae bacterium]